MTSDRPTSPISPPERLHDVRGVADALGVSIQTVYVLCSRKRLRHVRVGVGRGTIRIPDSALSEFIAGATVGPAPPAGRAPLPVGPKPPKLRHVRV